MNKLVYSALGFLAATVLGHFVQRWLADHDFNGLTTPDLRPGPWYCYYMGDYLAAHPEVTAVKSAVVELEDGVFVWATDTPEWDRGWFASRGWEFPDMWIPYDELQNLDWEQKAVGS